MSIPGRRDGRTALMFAVAGEQAIAATRLLDKGADVNAKDNAGLTPLMFAASGRHLGIINFLLKRGADVNAADRAG